MDRSKNLFSRGTLLFAGAGILVNALNYIVSIIVSWKLPTVSYGELNVLFSLLFILAIPTIIIQTFVSNIISEQEKKDHSEDVEASIFSTVLAFAVVFTLPILFFLPVITNFLHSSPIYVASIVLNVFLSFPLAAGRGILQGKKEFASLGKSLSLEVICKFSLVIVLVFLLGYSIGSVLLAVNIGTFFGLAAIYRRGWIRRQEFSSIHTSSNTSHFFHLFFGLSGIILLTNMDLVLMRHLLPELSGEYSALSRLGQIILMGTNIVASIFLPHYIGYYLRKESTKRIFFLSVFLVFLGGSVMTGLYFVFPSEIIVFLFGEKYLGGAPFLGILGASYLLVALSSVVGNYLLSLRKYWINFGIGSAMSVYILLVWLHHQTIDGFVWAFFWSSSVLFTVSCACLLIFWWYKDLQK